MNQIELKSHDRNLLSKVNTELSKKLSRGELDPRDILREINGHLDSGNLDTLEEEYLSKTKRQIIMREFARAAIEQQKYRQPKGMKGKDSKEYKELVSGKTGIPIIDAAVKSLKSGYPHNRARLLLARYAIRNANIDPELVSDFFKENLEDYSPVLNTFNVTSAASGANFGEPYFRKSNPITAAKKLDPKGEWQKEQGVDPDKLADKILEKIREGQEEWRRRWKEEEKIEKSLFPTRDPDKGKFFLTGLRAKGNFASFYKNYLKNESEYLARE